MTAANESTFNEFTIIEIDVHDCNLEDIKSKEKIQEFMIAVCKNLGDTRDNDCFIQPYGGGLLAYQQTNHSFITATFLQDMNFLYLNILRRNFTSSYAVISDLCNAYFGGKPWLSIKLKD